MEKTVTKTPEYIFYETQLKQNFSLNLNEEQIKAAVEKIQKRVHNEGEFFQFAYDPSSKQKSVLAKKNIKALEEVFLINHVSTFNIKNTRKDLESKERMLKIFETIVGDKPINDFPCLSNQKPVISSFEDIDLLRKNLSNGESFPSNR